MVTTDRLPASPTILHTSIQLAPRYTLYILPIRRRDSRIPLTSRPNREGYTNLYLGNVYDQSLSHDFQPPLQLVLQFYARLPERPLSCTFSRLNSSQYQSLVICPPTFIFGHLSPLLRLCLTPLEAHSAIPIIVCRKFSMTQDIPRGGKSTHIPYCFHSLEAVKQ